MPRFLLLSLLSSLSLAACGGEKTIGPVATLPDTRCDDGLCAPTEVVAELLDAQDALERCRPDAEQGYESDPSGLRIADVELREERGVMFVDVLLANTSPQGVYDAPGTEVEVLSGSALVANERGLNPDDSARTQVYSVGACQAESHRYVLELAPGERATLRVSALWDQSRAVDTVELEVVRPRAP